jgi:hypothetical protein
MYADVRDRIEAMWARYEPYCPDANFLTDAQLHFVERTWELRLACVLLDRGFPLVPSGAKGPDLCIDTSPRTWIEAIAVSAGTNEDRVQDRAARAFTPAQRGYTDAELPGIDWHGRPPSEESVILRCTHALETKSRAFERYRRDGIVKEDERCVVAMSLAGIEDAFYLCDYDRTPVFLLALFGIGAERLLLSSDEGEKAKLYRPKRPYVTKASGIEIPAYAFASGTHTAISGVFGTCADIVNAPIDAGREIMFVNNPRAAAPIPTGTFRFGMEFVASERPRGSKGAIERRDHRKPFGVATPTGSET